MKLVFLLLVCGLMVPVLGVAGVSGASAKGQIRITVLYDNYVYTEGTRADWGFSCLIELADETILFDTGTRPDILMHNVGRLGVDLSEIDRIVISHQHGDHTGGLLRVLEDVSGVPVYLPRPFPDDLVSRIESAGGVPVPVGEPTEIHPGVHLTGTMEGRVPEHALIVETGDGTLLITGCSHPGIENIVGRTRQIVDQDIRLVLGGFHLLSHSRSQLRAIMRTFREVGVLGCAPTHCTGDDAIAFIREAYGERCLRAGTGRQFVF